MRNKFNLSLEMVNYEPIAIIEIPEMGNLSAITACDEFKVTSQNDKEKLALAKDKCYLKGFYEGKLIVGEYSGFKV